MQALRGIRRVAVAAPRFTRSMGGHGHGHGEAAEARLFGEHAPAPGQARKKESWEFWNNVLIGGTLLIGVGFYYRQNTNPQDWARDEAEERLRRQAEGLPVHYGVNYAAIRYMKERQVISGAEAERLESGEVANTTPLAVRGGLTSPKSV